MTQPEQPQRIHESDARRILVEAGIERGIDDPRTAEQIVVGLYALDAAMRAEEASVVQSSVTTEEVPAYIPEPNRGGIPSLRPDSARRLNFF